MAVNRITGLATGMDTDAIIEQLMEASRAPLTKLEKNETKVEWQREALLEINSKFLAFRTSALDMKLQGTYKSYSAESGDKNYVTATANSDAQEGTYKVSVTSLATKTTLNGITMEQSISGNLNGGYYTSLKGTSFRITYNGDTKTIRFGENETFSSETELQDALKSKIDNAFGADQIAVNVEYGQIHFLSDTSLNLPVAITSPTEEGATDALQYLGISSGASTAFDTSKTLDEFLGKKSAGPFGGGQSYFSTTDEMKLTINGKEFTFNKNDTLAEVFDTLNKDTDIDVTIKYSDIKQSITITRDTSGAGRGLDISGGDTIIDRFWEKLGVNYYKYEAEGKLDEFTSKHGSYTTGTNAEFSITSPDGETATGVTSATNTFTYNGVSMTFLEADPTKNISITVSKNVDEVYDKIKSFTDSYNDLLVTLNKYYKEESSGYEPLTDAERESLSETQEEKWEKMAKKGILKRDSTLGDAINQMRSAVTSYVSGSTISSLFEIGISTSSYDSVNSENNGKLVIDEAKLKEALKSDLDGVATLFANSPQQIQGNKLTNTNINLDGTSFKVTYGGQIKTISLSGQYDLNDATSRTEFEDYMKDVFAKEFGEGKVTVTVTGGKILFNSNKSVNLQFNTSDDGIADSGKDALALFGVTDGQKYDVSERGFATKIYDICTTTMNSIVDKAGSSSTTVDSSILGKQLERIQESVKKQKDRLQALEDRYYAQFAAMEEAISNMNSQSSSIMNLLSTGG